MDIAPTWILAAILRVETGSELNAFGVVPGRIKVGAHGERGATQVREIAFREVAKPGESFKRLDYDHFFAVEITNRYLCKLYSRFKSWDKVIMAYNAGPSNYVAGRDYLLKVKQ